MRRRDPGTPTGLLRLGLPGEQRVGDLRHHHLAILVADLEAELDGASVRLAARRRGGEDLEARGERISGAHRPQPAQLVQSRGAQARRLAQEVLHRELVADGSGVPTTGDEAAEDAFPTSLVTQVEGLQIKLFREGDDLLPGDHVRPGLTRLTGLEVVEVAHGTPRMRVTLAAWPPDALHRPLAGPGQRIAAPRPSRTVYP